MQGYQHYSKVTFRFHGCLHLMKSTYDFEVPAVPLRETLFSANVQELMG